MAHTHDLEENLAEMTVASFERQHPDLFAEVTRLGKEAGEKSALERFEAIAKLAPDDAPFVVEQFRAGATTDQAKDGLITKLSALAKKPAEVKSRTDPALEEFAAEQARRAGTAANQSQRTGGS